MDERKVGNPVEIECPLDLKWAKKVTALYPRGWSPKLDALRECLEQKQAAETSPAEIEAETQATE